MSPEKPNDKDKPEDKKEDQKVISKDHCPKCGSPPSEHEVRDYNLDWHDGKVYCKPCGAFVRDWDAG